MDPTDSNQIMKRGVLLVALLLLLGFAAFLTVYIGQESAMVELVTVRSQLQPERPERLFRERESVREGELSVL